MRHPIILRAGAALHRAARCARGRWHGRLLSGICLDTALASACAAAVPLHSPWAAWPLALLLLWSHFVLLPLAWERTPAAWKGRDAAAGLGACAAALTAGFIESFLFAGAAAAALWPAAVHRGWFLAALAASLFACGVMSAVILATALPRYVSGVPGRPGAAPAIGAGLMILLLPPALGAASGWFAASIAAGLAAAVPSIMANAVAVRVRIAPAQPCRTASLLMHAAALIPAGLWLCSVR